jgi:hypothetical protein
LSGMRQCQRLPGPIHVRVRVYSWLTSRSLIETKNRSAAQASRLQFPFRKLAHLCLMFVANDQHGPKMTCTATSAVEICPSGSVASSRKVSGLLPQPSGN